MKKETPPVQLMSVDQAIEIGKRAVCNKFGIDARELGPVPHDLMEQSLQSGLETYPERRDFQDALKIINSLRARELEGAQKAKST